MNLPIISEQVTIWYLGIHPKRDPRLKLMPTQITELPNHVQILIGIKFKEKFLKDFQMQSNALQLDKTWEFE